MAESYVSTISPDPQAVFLDENNRVKLGDFGLAKALAQASFAQTYVGVRFSIPGVRPVHHAFYL